MLLGEVGSTHSEILEFSEGQAGPLGRGVVSPAFFLINIFVLEELRSDPGTGFNFILN